MIRGFVSLVVLGAVVVLAPPVAAHSGPPYPIVSNVTAGSYRVSVWTDPDTTDDGSAQGKFWVTLQTARANETLDPATRVDVSVQGRQPAAPRESQQAVLQKSDPATFYAALTMDHEGPYAVHVAIDGATGRAEVDCEVQATYDLRPSPFLLVIYVMPFVLVALLWGKLLFARRRASRSSVAS